MTTMNDRIYFLTDLWHLGPKPEALHLYLGWRPVDHLQFVSDETMVPWVEEVYQAAHDDQIHYATNLVFRHLSSMILDENWNGIEEQLECLNVRRLSPIVMVAFLTSALPAKDHIRNYMSFYRRVSQKVKELVTSGELDDILNGLGD